MARRGAAPEARAGAHRRPARARPGRDADRRAGDEPLRPRGVARPRAARPIGAARAPARRGATSPRARRSGVASAVVTEPTAPLQQQLEEIRAQLAWVRDYL